MPMLTGAFSQLLSRDFQKVFFDGYTRQDTEFDKVANVSTMDGAYIREGEAAGLKALQAVGEGEPISYDAFMQGNEKTVTPSDFALGVSVSRNMYDDDRTGIMKKAGAELGKAAAYTRELKFWDLFNAGFVTTTRVGIDGAALFSSHTLMDGAAGTYANYAATGSSLSMTTLQAMCDRFELMPNERGIPIRIKPKLLIVPPQLRWKAEQLLKNEYNPENANNESNYSEIKGLQFMVSHYLTSTTAWFLVGDKSDHDLRFIWRKQLQLQSTDDFDTRTAKFMAVMRFQTTFYGWRGVDGNAGA